MRQNLKEVHARRFQSPPQALADALDGATLEQLGVWLLRFATASADELLASASRREGVLPREG